MSLPTRSSKTDPNMEIAKTLGIKKAKPALLVMIRPTFLSCRYVGLFPVTGLEKSVADIRFTWKSVYMIFYMSSVTIQTLMTLFLIYDLLYLGLSIKRSSGFLFYFNNLTCTILVLRFGLRMKDLLIRVESIEDNLIYQCCFNQVTKYSNIVLGVTLSLAFVEHLLYVLQALGLLNIYTTTSDTSVYSSIFEFFNYKNVLGIIMQFTNFQSTYMWNTNDVIVLTFSMYLVTHFENFNKLFKQMEQNDGSDPELTWTKLQIQYTKLVQLVKTVDQEINSLVFVSFACNLCFICQQLFHVISNWEGDFYFGFTFFYLVGRTALVSLIAARLHTASREPLESLHTIDKDFYTTESQSLMDQIHFSKVGLTGFGCFYVTRSVILTIVTTIVTYELVVLQLHRHVHH